MLDAQHRRRPLRTSRAHRRGRAVRVGIVGVLTAVLGGALALAGTTSASAATVGHWGTFSVSGSTRNYTGSMALAGFPGTTFTSTSRQAQVISGASVWQGTGTPPGAVYGSSRGNTYLNQRPSADNQSPGSAAQTVYTFDTPTPVGGWSFVLGDIDADQATITATDANGLPVSVGELGYVASYNSCSSVSPGGWSCGAPTTDDPNPGSDRPTWNTQTGVLLGNAKASDTSGASAWFSPTVPLGSLTITYQQRSGFPVYQTWFADTTAALTGSVTLDGTPLPGTPVTATDSSGTVHRTTTAADGSYSFPELVRTTADYTVAVDGPPGASGTPQQPVSLTAGDGSAPFAFTSPPAATSVIGTVTTTVDGETVPAAGVPVMVGTTPTTTNEGGGYSVSDLPVETPITISVPGDSTTITTGAAGTPATVPPLVATPTVGIVTGSATLDSSPLAGATVTLSDGTGVVVATVTTGADGRYTFPSAPPGTYTVTIDPPAGSDGTPTATTTITAGDTTTVPEFVFTTPPPVETASLTGTLTDSSGAPSAGTEVSASSGPSDTVTTATDPTGAFELDGLQPSTSYVITADGATLATVTTPASGTVSLGTLALPAAGGGTGSGGGGTGAGGTGTGGAPSGGTSTSGSAATSVSSFGDGALAYTGSNPTPAIIGAGILVAIGVAFLVARAVRGRRDRHLEDD
jgi:hypothetical protein